jgi:aryl-alcohol dehydrogenase
VKVTAAVLRDADGPFSLESVSLPDELAEHEILVQIAGVGMCHTDLAVRRSNGASPLPAVLGHEGSGVVTAVGPAVRALAPGDHVVLSFDSCGSCRSCLRGRPAYCVSFADRNLFGKREEGSTASIVSDGVPLAPRWFGQSSYAHYAIASERNAVHVATTSSVELLGPLGCGLMTGAGSVIHSFAVRPGDALLVTGLGAVGLGAVMAAALIGAGPVIGVDQHANRRDLALGLGATHAIPAGPGGLAERVLKLTGGVDFAFDSTGDGELINGSLKSLQEEGTLGLVCRHRYQLALEPATLDKGRKIMHIFEGSAVPQIFIPQLLALWQQGRFPFDRLVRTYPLNAINDAERDSASGLVVKPVLIPGG